MQVHITGKLKRRLKRWYVKRCVSDKRYLMSLYKERTGKTLNLQNPRAFTEKIQWLKLYWRHEILTRCADKYEVRKFVRERVGPELLKKLYGIYDRTEDVNIDHLPDAFVLKVNHGWNQNIFCKKKSEFDWNHASVLLKKYLKHQHYYSQREWAYKNIVPRIMCEEYLTKDGERMYEYQFYCYNGIPRLVQILDNKARQQNMFDLDLNLLKVNSPLPPLSSFVVKPVEFEKMLEYASSLSRGFPFVRVDLLNANNRISFGEMTFYPNGGLHLYDPASFDLFLGSFLDLPVTEVP